MATRQEVINFVTEELATASAIKTAEELRAAPETKLFADLQFTSEHAMIISGAIEEEYDLDYVDPSDIMGCKDVNDVVDLVCGLVGVADDAPKSSKASKDSRTGYVGTPDAEEALGTSDDMSADDIAAFFPEFGN